MLGTKIRKGRDDAPVRLLCIVDVCKRERTNGDSVEVHHRGLRLQQQKRSQSTQQIGHDRKRPLKPLLLITCFKNRCCLLRVCLAAGPRNQSVVRSLLGLLLESVEAKGF